MESLNEKIEILEKEKVQLKRSLEDSNKYAQFLWLIKAPQATPQSVPHVGPVIQDEC